MTVGAQDDIGQETIIDAGSFSVAGQPNPGRLTVSNCAMGVVRVGESVQRSVVIRNTGGPGTTPVEATISLYGSAFSLASDATVVLSAGQRTIVTVTFSPLRSGLAIGVLAVSRADGKQDTLGCLLVGVGRR